MPRGTKIVLDPEQEKGIWLAHEQGWTIRKIAAFFNLSRTWVGRFLRMPQSRPLNNPELVFPPGGHLRPDSEPTPIRDGDVAMCMVSHQTGFEHARLLQKPRPKPKPQSKAKFKPKGLKSQ